MAPPISVPKRITPSRFQSPELLTPCASHSVRTAPPEASTILSLPFAKNPMNRLSGDQNGLRAPSVPGSEWAGIASSGRTYNIGCCARAAAENARRRPSGEAAKVAMVVPSGAATENRTGGGGESGCNIHAVNPNEVRRNTRAIAAYKRSREMRRLAVAAVAGAAPISAIHCSSRSRSRAVCHRSSGSLARQVLTTRSSAGGATGWIVEIGGGSLPIIAAINVAWFFPSNAFLLVTIS